MDTQQKFKELIETNSLYPENFIKVFGRNDVHWNLETWKKRERALAHDMVCLLLSNLEAQNDAPTSILNEYVRKRRACERIEELSNLMGTQAKRSRVESHNVDSDDDENDNDDYGLDSDDEEITDIEMIDPNLAFYRYIPLEGQSNPAHVQNTLLSKWGIESKTKIFDIIDMIDKKLIEVKFSRNFNTHLQNYANDPNTDEHTELIVVSPETGLVQSTNETLLPGIPKVTIWVLHRKAVMGSKSITDYGYDEEDDISQYIFNNAKINTLLDDFSNFVLHEEHSTVDTIEPEELELEIEKLDAEFLFNNLTQKHLDGGKNTIKWTGKLLPSCWKLLIDAEDHDDDSIDAIYTYLDERDIKEVKGDKKLYDFFKEIQRVWDTLENEGRNFMVLNCKTKKLRENIDSTVKWALGIDKKDKKQNDVEGLKQEKFSAIPELKYNNWFDELYCKLTENHNYFHEYPFLLLKEKDDFIGMYREMQLTVESFNKGVASRNIGIMMSEIENFYSRLCGSYLAGNGKIGSHSRVVMMPIISTFNSSTSKTIKHRVSGLVIRGPTHSRALSDRTNIVTVELANSDFSTSTIGKHCEIIYEDGTRVIVRQNAYKKIDAPYNAYIKNALFGPTNLLGDIFNKTSLEYNKIDVVSLTKQIRTDKNYVDFFVERVVEGVLMCVIGNSRDEGYFSMLRKLLMIFISMRRGNSTFSLNRKEFCDSINECIVDNPLSMFFHNTVLFICAYFVNGSIN